MQEQNKPELSPWYARMDSPEFLRELAESLKSDFHIEPGEYEKLLDIAKEIETLRKPYGLGIAMAYGCVEWGRTAGEAQSPTRLVQLVIGGIPVVGRMAGIRWLSTILEIPLGQAMKFLDDGGTDISYEKAKPMRDAINEAGGIAHIR